MKKRLMNLAGVLGIAAIVSAAHAVEPVQETSEYEQPGSFYDPDNIQANVDKPIERLSSANCRVSSSAEADRSYQKAGFDWDLRWRFAEDKDIQLEEAFTVISGYRFLLGTIVDYDLDGIDDYARVVTNVHRDSAILVRFGASNKEPALLNYNVGLLSGQSIKGTHGGCLVVGFPESGTVSYFMESGVAKAVYVDDDG